MFRELLHLGDASVVRGVERAGDDDRSALALEQASDPSQNLVAIHERKVQVEDEDVGDFGPNRV